MNFKFVVEFSLIKYFQKHFHKELRTFLKIVELEYDRLSQILKI